MKQVFCFLLLLLTSLGGFAQQMPAPAATPPPVSFNSFVRDSFYPAVYTLYLQRYDGGYRMLCTTTSFRDPSLGKNKYRFASAGHCVEQMDIMQRIFFGAQDTNAPATYFIARDEKEDAKVYYRASVVARGKGEKGDDFAVFEIDTKDLIPTMPLGDDPVDAIDQPIVNVANPMGLGTQVFHGNISRTFLDRHLGPDNDDWYGDLLVQEFGVNGGSSGSAMVCEKQRAICGFIIGVVGDTTMVATPVSRFKTWYTNLNRPVVRIPIFQLEDFKKIQDAPKDPPKKPRGPSKPSKRPPQGKR
jgi:hypothetical protein